MHRGTIAYCTVPKIGGTFNFYVLLRRALAPLGWEVLAAVPGRAANSLWDDEFADEGCVPIAADELDIQKISQALADWCVERKVDVLMPMSVQAAVSAIPHLPPQVRAVMRCSNITRHAYDIVSVHRSSVRRVVATSKRQYDDLRAGRGISLDKLRLIPHGVDLSAFEKAAQQRIPSPRKLRLGFVGRLANPSKGIFLIPKILQRLADADLNFEIIIVGDGPDRGRFSRDLSPFLLAGQARMVGGQPHEKIPEFLAEMDVLLMPSRFEGFGFSLIEAMAAGVVPIVSRIRGVTDWIVDEGTTGFVCPAHSAHAFADAARTLATTPDRLSLMSQSAQQAARERFSLERMGRDYDRLFREVVELPPLSAPPLDWAQFEPSKAFEPTFQRWIPQPLYGPLRALVDFWRNRA